MDTKDTLNPFESAVKQYLDARAERDGLFRQRYENLHKNIRECCRYIVDQVCKEGRCGWADEEIYGLAVHYYDEDNIGEIKDHNLRIVVNTHIDAPKPEKKPGPVENGTVDEYMKAVEERRQKEAEQREKERRNVQLTMDFDFD